MIKASLLKNNKIHFMAGWGGGGLGIIVSLLSIPSYLATLFSILYYTTNELDPMKW